MEYIWSSPLIIAFNVTLHAHFQLHGLYFQLHPFLVACLFLLVACDRPHGLYFSLLYFTLISHMIPSSVRLDHRPSNPSGPHPTSSGRRFCPITSSVRSLVSGFRLCLVAGCDSARFPTLSDCRFRRFRFDYRPVSDCLLTNSGFLSNQFWFHNRHIR